MWTVTENDFNEIKSWGLEKNPFAAIDDYSHEKEAMRCNNEEHLRAHNDYIQKRLDYIKSKDFNDYYKSESKPIDHLRWRYLMNRKAWFIMPLGWDEIAKNGNVIIDFGCGDGDTVQRLTDFVDSYWNLNQVKPRKIKIIGLDLNPSRIDNAKNLVKTTNKNIEIEFRVADLVGSKFPFQDCYCDYGICTGVLEILDNVQYKTFVKEMCRLTSTGIYIEDLYDEYPGGYPRDDIADEFMFYGFKLKRREIILTEPFQSNGLSDPKKLWPILKDQNLYFEKS